MKMKNFGRKGAYTSTTEQVYNPEITKTRSPLLLVSYNVHNH